AIQRERNRALKAGRQREQVLRVVLEVFVTRSRERIPDREPAETVRRQRYTESDRTAGAMPAAFVERVAPVRRAEQRQRAAQVRVPDGRIAVARLEVVRVAAELPAQVSGLRLAEQVRLVIAEESHQAESTAQ